MSLATEAPGCIGVTCGLIPSISNPDKNTDVFCLAVLIITLIMVNADGSVEPQSGRVDKTHGILRNLISKRGVV